MLYFQNNNSNENAKAAEVPKKMTLPLENDLPNPNFVRLPDGEDNQDVVTERSFEKDGNVNGVRKEDSNIKDARKEDKSAPESFLKSILMDRMTRKRSFGEDETPYVVKGEDPIPQVPRSPPKVPAAEDCNDILRRRLLGLKDPNYDLMQQRRPPQQPQRIEVKETPAEEMKGVDHEEVVQTVEDNNRTPLEEDASREDAAVGPARPPDYSHTSVLKHLLHRYTGGENNEEEEDGGKAD